jgi:hypothetical protein
MAEVDEADGILCDDSFDEAELAELLLAGRRVMFTAQINPLIA